MPFFSIIVPVYNRADIIQKTIQQILLQTYSDFEVIVVDDGSTDNSHEIAASIPSLKVQVYKKENGERGAARNFGAQKASGKYLIFFDSDDLMYDFHLQEVYQYLTAHGEPEVAYTAFEFVNKDGASLRKVFINNKGLKAKLLTHNFLGCNSVIIRQDIFKQFWFNENRHLATSEDRELWLRVVSVYPFHFIPKISFAMVEHEGRSLNNIPAAKKEAVTLALVEALNASTIFKQAFHPHYPFLFGFEYCLLSSIWSSEGNKSKAGFYLRAAWSSSKRVLLTKRFWAAAKNYYL